MTDGDGRFRLPRLVPRRGEQFAVQVAAVKDHWLAARRLAVSSNARRGTYDALDPVTLRCDAAAAITLVVQDGNGRPVPGARVVPSSRQAADGRWHLVCFQGSPPPRARADDEGRVGLKCFGGDEGEIYVRLPGKDWELHAISIPAEGETVVVSIGDVVDARF